MILAVSALVVLLLILFVLLCFVMNENSKLRVKKDTVGRTEEVNVTEEFLDPSEYSRSGKKLLSVKGIVVHYTANPGTDADANRNYFNGLAEVNKGSKKPVYASSHYIIGLDGKIVQCIPLDEMSYASNDRNDDTISIECCHPDETGKFNQETYNSLVRLTAWLCGEYNIHSDEIIRHYDVTGKICPKFYVEHEDKWKAFKNDVFEYIEKNSIKETD